MLLYRISSYFLIIIAALFGFMSLFALLIALSNPALLLSLFVVVAVVIYSISSFIFLIKGIDQQLSLKSTLQDLIKVNAYVAIIFVGMNIFQSVSILNNPAAFNDAMKQFATMQTSKSPFSTTLMLKLIKAVVWFMLFYSLVLGIHITVTFRLLKQYAQLFGEKKRDDINPTRID